MHKFFNSFFVSVNGPQTLQVKPGCFKCISGINLSPANKNLFTISFIFVHLNKILPKNGILFSSALIN